MRRVRGASPSTKKPGTLPPSPESARWCGDHRAVLLVAVALLATILCYLPALGNHFTNWDDNLYVTENPLLKTMTPANFWKIATTPIAFNYHPLTIYSLQLNYALSELNPAPYYLTNVLLHLANCVLVFYLVYRLTARRAEAAFLVAVLFGIHPMHVESVAWISERKDVLYAFFLFLSLIAYVAYVQDPRRRSPMLLAALIFFILSLFSKPAAVILPALLVAVDYYYQRQFTARLILEKLPFLILAVFFGLITLRVQAAFLSVNELKELTLLQRLFVACYGFDWYLIRFAVPRGLSAFHPYPDLAKAWPIELVAAPVLVLATVGVVLWSRRYTRAAAFGTLFFGLALVLVLQALPIGIAIVAERYTYVSYVGVGFVLAMGYEFWIRRWRSKQWLVLGTRATAAVVILGLSYLCFERVQVWRNSGTLWTDAIEKYPTLGSAYISRGAFYMKELRDYDAAMRDFDRAVALAPHDYTSYFNRGVLFQRLGDKARAVEDYSRAIATNPTKPGPYVNRGGMYCELKQFDAAVEDYSRALALDPAAQSYFNRGAALYLAGAYDRALTDYDAGLRLKQDDADKLFFKGVIEFRLKRYDGAIVSLSRALAIQPKDGRSYLYRARCYAALGRMEAARKDAFTARELGESVQDGLVDEKE